jgi:hypothetical protein
VLSLIILKEFPFSLPDGKDGIVIIGWTGRNGKNYKRPLQIQWDLFLEPVFGKYQMSFRKNL